MLLAWLPASELAGYHQVVPCGDWFGATCIVKVPSWMIATGYDIPNPAHGFAELVSALRLRLIFLRMWCELLDYKFLKDGGNCGGADADHCIFDGKAGAAVCVGIVGI